MNKPIKILLIVVVILVVLGFLRDIIIKTSLEAGARYVSGANVKIGGLSLGIIGQSIKITDLRLFNPAGFPQDKVMVNIPEVAVRADAAAYFRGMLHVPYIRLNLEEVRVIRNKDGKLNVNSLNFAQQPSGQLKPEAQSAKNKMKMQLDLVSLNIGKVVLEDYSQGGAQPKVSTFNVNLKDKEYKNITDPAQLGSAVMMSALAPVGLDNAFRLGAKALNDMYGIGTTTVDGTTKAVTDSVGGLFQGVKDVLK